MFDRLKNFFAKMEKRKVHEVWMQIDRSHFHDAFDPIEARLAEALHSFPPSELGFLIMSFGLDSRNPKTPQGVAQALGMMLLKVLDNGTGAELRLRNRMETRVLIEAIAGEEVPSLARHLEAISVVNDEQRRKAATEVWFYSRRPLRRLAMSTVLEGGFGAFLALVRERRQRMDVASPGGRPPAPVQLRFNEP